MPEVLPDSAPVTTLIVGAETTTNASLGVSREFSLLAACSEAFEYAMRPNWDGPGTRELTQSVVRLAEMLIDQLGTLEHLAEVAPGHDGSLSFVWDDENGRYIHLDVGPNDTVHLYRDVAGIKWEGVSVASDHQFLGEISRTFRATGWPLCQMAVVRFNYASNSRRIPVLQAA